MPMWRCPHCGTPQAETARCWVCHRSSTACATCRNFRRGVAAQLGYCGLDRLRRPLRGVEIRGCWEASTVQPDALEVGPVTLKPRPLDPAEERTPVRKLEFVEVRTTSARSRRRSTGAVAAGVGATAGVGIASEADDADTDEPQAPLVSPTEPRWSLWGDAEG